MAGMSAAATWAMAFWGSLVSKMLPFQPTRRDPLDPGPGEEGGRDPIGDVLKKGEGPIGLVGVDVDESVPGLKEELEVSEDVLGRHGPGSVFSCFRQLRRWRRWVP